MDENLKAASRINAKVNEVSSQRDGGMIDLSLNDMVRTMKYVTEVEDEMHRLTKVLEGINDYDYAVMVDGEVLGDLWVTEAVAQQMLNQLADPDHCAMARRRRQGPVEVMTGGS